MTSLVPRTVREIRERSDQEEAESSSRPINDFQCKAAYVLVGPPGSGKTSILEHEAGRQGGEYVSARDFLTFEDRQQWHDTMLFIDGLDEARAGLNDGRTPLDGIRARLDRLGCPRFRLSCREADWFGANDRDRLKSVSPDGTVAVLRIDPLSDAGIRQILCASPGTGDSRSFVDLAHQKGIDGLLSNPQSLKMLVAAVGADGNWPETRLQTFDMACRTLLKEHRDEHRLANPNSIGIPVLMDACGKLCAIQLLTGVAGYALAGTESTRHFLGLDQLPGHDGEIFRRCLQSKLFEAPTPGRGVPVHRLIAEFLAGRYLANLVDNGLPVGRILALLTGHDGKVVSVLRGLAAWLAAHGRSSRAEIIASDPLGTVLYGDARHFSGDEKRLLLEGLRQEASANPRTLVSIKHDSRLGDLVSPDMDTFFRENLAAPSREASWQSFVVVLLEALLHGRPRPGLAESCLMLLRDDTRWQRIRLCALDVYLHIRKNDRNRFEGLRILTDEVYAGKVPDPDHSLLGCLLTALYPTAISETEITRYLRVPPRPNRCPEYGYFWTGHLPKKSTRDQLTRVLDELVAGYQELLSKDRTHRLPAFFLRRLPSTLIGRWLQLSSGDIELPRVFRWLGAVELAGERLIDPDVGHGRPGGIRNWLECRPDAWKTLLAMGIQRCIGQGECDGPDSFVSCIYTEEHHRLLGVARPADFGLWCLDQAVLTNDPVASDWLLGEVANCLHFGRLDEGLSRETVSKRLSGHVRLHDAFLGAMAELEAPGSPGIRSVDRAQLQRRNEHPDWREHVSPHADDLRQNRGKPALLHQLAEVFFGGYIDIRGNTPIERLDNLLGGDKSLVEAVLSGLRGVIERDDLPSDAEIIRLGTKGRTHYLALPFMAALEESTRFTLRDGIVFPEELSRLAVAIYYTVPIWSTARESTNQTPRWLRWSLSNHPGVVTDVMVRSILSKLRNGMETPAGIEELAHSQEYEQVARLSLMTLLRRFPVRCKFRQLSSLNLLLSASMRFCGSESHIDLIETKLRRREMNVAQRVHWLVVGAWISPDLYVDKLEMYVAGHERRVRFLAVAVAGQADLMQAWSQQNVPTLKVLIELVGASCHPYYPEADSDMGGFATPGMKAADCVRGFIEQLAMIPNTNATEALESLRSDDDLRPWRSLLAYAGYRQSALRRESGFAYCNVEQVLRTLENSEPANAADLAALTFEHLREIAIYVRHGDTSDWRQYWNVDGYHRPQDPRPEDACRDRLLSDLKNRLERSGIDVRPEGRYANDRRSDIRVSRGCFNVPVEVKKSCHRDLWSAVRTQLMADYSRDPGAQGHGIYLVFWFGNTEHCRLTPPPSGSLPAGPDDLEGRLKATLSADESLKVRVCVIDAAIPDAK